MNVMIFSCLGLSFAIVSCVSCDPERSTNLYAAFRGTLIDSEDCDYRKALSEGDGNPLEPESTDIKKKLCEDILTSYCSKKFGKSWLDQDAVTSPSSLRNSPPHFSNTIGEGNDTRTSPCPVLDNEHKHEYKLHQARIKPTKSLESVNAFTCVASSENTENKLQKFMISEVYFFSFPDFKLFDMTGRFVLLWNNRDKVWQAEMFVTPSTGSSQWVNDRTDLERFVNGLKGATFVPEIDLQQMSDSTEEIISPIVSH